MSADQGFDQENRLVENLRKTGLRVIVIDEDTDWSKMPSPASLLGYAEVDQEKDDQEVTGR
jgi:hypothetical protein